jgi:ferrous iron transport protein B
MDSTSTPRAAPSRPPSAGRRLPLAAFAFLVFVLLYVPCVAAVATIRKEMGSFKWTVASVAWQITVAYTVSLIIYQIGRIFFLG